MFKRQDYSAVFCVFFFSTSLPFLNIIVIIIIIILFLLVVRRSENTRCGKDTHTHKKKNFSGLWSVMMGTWFPPPHCRCWPCMKQLLNAWELYSVCKPTRVAETPSLFKPLANHLNWLRSIGNSSTKPTTGFLSPSFWSETKMGKERRKKK